MSTRGAVTEFLNVDLDIYSRSNLTPLVGALGEMVFVLYLGRPKNTWEARLELSILSRRQEKDPNAIIQKMATLIEALPSGPRAIWDKAKRREFSIGVQAGLSPNSFDLAIEPKTLAAASKLNARIVLTLYAHEFWLRSEKRR